MTSSTNFTSSTSRLYVGRRSCLESSVDKIKFLEVRRRSPLSSQLVSANLTLGVLLVKKAYLGYSICFKFFKEDVVINMIKRFAEVN